MSFYKNRTIERPDVCDVDEINLQVFKIQEWIMSDLEAAIEKGADALSAETKKLSALPDKDLKDFDLLEDPNAKVDLKSPNINSFAEIGWIDPFPMEKSEGGPAQKMPKLSAAKKKAMNEKALAEAIAQEQKKALEFARNLEGGGGIKKILSIVFPVRIMMIKMMRACIGVSKPQDLWMYNEPDEDEIERQLAKVRKPDDQNSQEEELE